MSDEQDPGGAERLYEIGFEGDVREAVQRLGPAARVCAVPTSTVLWCSASRPDQLDVLLDSLVGMGITPREVYEYPRGVAQVGDGSYCEVRLGGCLGTALLQYLGWSHRVAQTTVVTIRASYEALGAVLAQMSTVTRVDYVLAL